MVSSEFPLPRPVVSSQTHLNVPIPPSSVRLGCVITTARPLGASPRTCGLTAPPNPRLLFLFWSSPDSTQVHVKMRPPRRKGNALCLLLRRVARNWLAGCLIFVFSEKREKTFRRSAFLGAPGIIIREENEGPEPETNRAPSLGVDSRRLAFSAVVGVLSTTELCPSVPCCFARRLLKKTRNSAPNQIIGDWLLFVLSLRVYVCPWRAGLRLDLIFLSFGSGIGWRGGAIGPGCVESSK